MGRTGWKACRIKDFLDTLEAGWLYFIVANHGQPFQATFDRASVDGT